MLTSNVWLAPARMWLSPPFPFIAFWGGVDKRLEWSVVVRHQLKAAMVTNKWNRSFFFLFFLYNVALQIIITDTCVYTLLRKETVAMCHDNGFSKQGVCTDVNLWQDTQTWPLRFCRDLDVWIVLCCFLSQKKKFSAKKKKKKKTCTASTSLLFQPYYICQINFLSGVFAEHCHNVTFDTLCFQLGVIIHFVHLGGRGRYGGKHEDLEPRHFTLCRNTFSHHNARLQCK